MKILLKYPTRSRPDLFKKRVSEWSEMASGEHELLWIVSADEDDATMNNEEIKEFCKEKKVNIFFDKSNTKISACNTNITKDGWDYLLLISDDMVCVEKEWDKIVHNIFNGSKTGTIWFKDGLNHSLCTFCVMTNAYYNKFGYVYNPEYVSVYADNEFTIMAMLNQEMVIGEPSIVKHEWVGKELKDDLHNRNETNENYMKDKIVFDNHMRRIKFDNGAKI